MTMPVFRMLTVALNAAPDGGRALGLGTIAGDCVLLIATCFLFSGMLWIACTAMLWMEAMLVSRLRVRNPEPSEIVFLPGECLGFFRRSSKKIRIASIIVVLAWTVARTGVGSVNLGVFEPVPSVLTWISTALRSHLGAA